MKVFVVLLNINCFADYDTSEIKGIYRRREDADQRASEVYDATGSSISQTVRVVEHELL